MPRRPRNGGAAICSALGTTRVPAWGRSGNHLGGPGNDSAAVHNGLLRRRDGANMHLLDFKGDGAGTSADIPILSGLPVEHMSEGMRIPSKYRALIEQIADIRRKPQKYFAAVSEICVVPKEYGNYELVLIPAKSKIRVLTDRTLNEDSLKYMMVVLDVVNSMEPNVSEIDLRYGSVSYRKK